MTEASHLRSQEGECVWGRGEVCDGLRRRSWGSEAAVGVLLSEDCHVDIGLRAALAHHQIPPAILVFLQPELCSKVHARVQCCVVTEGPAGERAGAGREGQRKNGRRQKQLAERWALCVSKDTHYPLAGLPPAPECSQQITQAKSQNQFEREKCY